MKPQAFLSLPVLLLLLTASLAQAHSGRTNANGCHTNHKTGEYHCHGGTSNSGVTPNEPSVPPSIPINDGSNIIQLPSNSRSQPVLTVESVKDGDTINVKDKGKIISVRLGCVDTPEKDQTPWGLKATTRLKQLLPKGQVVQIRTINTDRYGRTVGEVYSGNQSINLQLVKEGQAVVYPQYLNGCGATKNQYLQAETQAKQKRLGFWNQSNPVMPWNFRKN